MIAVIVWGYRMWWQRRPTRGTRLGGGAATAAGCAAATLATRPSLLVIAVTVGVGWFLPLFGISLLAFLLVDAVIAALKKAR